MAIVMKSMPDVILHGQLYSESENKNAVVEGKTRTDTMFAFDKLYA